MPLLAGVYSFYRSHNDNSAARIHHYRIQQVVMLAISYATLSYIVRNNAPYSHFDGTIVLLKNEQ